MGRSLLGSSAPDSFGKYYFDSGQRKPGRFARYSKTKLQRLNDFLVQDLSHSFNIRRHLDVGCAKGYLVEAFRRAGVESYGIDISEYALSAADSQIRPYLSRVDLGFQPIPFDDNHFDLVTCVSVMEYMKEQANAVKELHRVMAGNGVLLVTLAYSAPASDNYRKNLHGETFWIHEFESSGFVFMQQLTNTKYSSYARAALSAASSFQSSIAKLLLDSWLSREQALRILRSRYGVLFFEARK